MYFSLIMFNYEQNKTYLYFSYIISFRKAQTFLIVTKALISRVKMHSVGFIKK